jgi:hypothetical protein
MGLTDIETKINQCTARIPRESMTTGAATTLLNSAAIDTGPQSLEAET